MRKAPPACFGQLRRGLHQDALLLADDPAELAAVAVRGVPPEQQPVLLAYQRSTLASSTPAELKGLLNRASPDMRFTPKSAVAFLAAVVAALAAERPR